MKKKVTGFAIAFACTAALGMSAFAGEPTVDDVLSMYQEAGTSVNEFNCTADMAADISIAVPDAGAEGTFSIAGNADLDMAMSLDPLAGHITMDMAGDAMGQSADIQMDIYMAGKDDGAFGIYVSGDAMGEVLDWQYVEVPAETAAQFMNALANRQAANIDLPIPFELNGTTDVNGRECYVLAASVTWEDMKAIIPSVMEQVKDMLPEEEASSLEDLDSTLEMAGAILGGLVANIEIDVETETGLPAKAHFDTEGSDWTILGALFAQYADLTNEDGSLMNVDINVNDLHLDYLYDYETPVEITVPEEAIAAEANGTVLDPADAEAIMEGAVMEAESELG